MDRMLNRAYEGGRHDRRPKNGSRASSRDVEVERSRVYEQPYLIRVMSPPADRPGSNR